MQATDPARGKSEAGGSLILTASGESNNQLETTGDSHTFHALVAGLRSGAGSLECE